MCTVHPECDYIWPANIYLFQTAKTHWGHLKFKVWSPKSKIPNQNGCQKTPTRNSNQSVIIKITQHHSKWPPQKLIKLSPNIIVIWKSHNSCLVIFGLCYAYILSFLQNSKTYYSWHVFCKTLFLPEFLPNQLEILTQHSQCNQEGCCGFSNTSIVLLRINPGFSGSLYSWMAKGSFCLLVKWADTALCCSSNAKGSICSLVKWADTAFWLARQ